MLLSLLQTVHCLCENAYGPISIIIVIYYNKTNIAKLPNWNRLRRQLVSQLVYIGLLQLKVATSIIQYEL